MINFTIHHKKEPLNKVVAVELPMNADNLSDLLQELGYEPPEKLKVNSKGKPYVIELNSDTNMGFAILERLCDNDTIAELNNLCTVICKCSDQDYIYQTIFNSDVRCINGIKKLFADRFMEFSDKLVLNTSLERKPTELAVKGCTDNDEGGIDAYDRLSDILQERGYTNVTRIYSTNKDFNEDLKARNGQPAKVAVPHEKKQTFYGNVDNLDYYPCRPDKLTSQFRAAFKTGQYRYLAEYALAGSAFFMRVKNESKAHSALKAKLRKEYRAYKDKARIDVKCRDLSNKLKEVLSDLKQPARTYEQSIATAKRLYELADCAVKVETEADMVTAPAEEMSENEDQDEEAELSPLPSLS